MAVKYITVGILLFTGCFDTPADAVKNIKFFREPKSGLCFASGTLNMGDCRSSTFSWVPCENIPPNMLEKVK